MRELPFADRSFSSLLAVHSLEHVPDPERVIAEAARVIEPGGIAIFVTPNRLTFGRPDEIIDPYHFVEFDPGELRALCATGFDDVEVRGIFGSAAYMRIFDADRAELDRLLGRDPLRLRRLVPRSGRQWLYDTLLRRRRTDEDPRGRGDRPDRLPPRRRRTRRRSRPLRVLPPPGSMSAAAPERCAWCGAELTDGARLRGRIRCARCGAATTDPWPDAAGLEAAYGTWYRPDAGARFHFAGDLLLGRTRGLLASRLDAIAPRRADPRHRRRRGHAPRRPALARPRGGRPRAQSAPRRLPRPIARRGRGRRRMGRGRLLAHARAPPRAAPARSTRPPACCDRAA